MDPSPPPPDPPPSHAPSTHLAVSTEFNRGGSNLDPQCPQSIHSSNPATEGELSCPQEQDSQQGAPILTELARDIQTLLQTNTEGLKTTVGAQESPRHKGPQRKSIEVELGNGSSNGGEDRCAVQRCHSKAHDGSCASLKVHPVKSILKNSRPSPTSQATRPATAPSWQIQKQHTRYTQQEKAKGVLDSSVSTLHTPPEPPHLHQPSIHLSSASSRETGETSKRAQSSSGKGSWEEVKHPYWWRKEQQESRPSAGPRLRTGCDRGKILFRRHAVNKCFNCLIPGHQVNACRNPTRCWRCELTGHHAFKCPRLPTATARLKAPPRAQSSVHHTQPPPQPALVHEGRSYLEAARGLGTMAAYPGDPRARQTGERVCISATGAIKRRRDALVGKAAVCSIEENSHNTKSYHVSDAIRSRMNLDFGDFQVIKHYPEQYLVIFSDPRDLQRAITQCFIIDNGRTFNFAPWDETREAVDAHMEFRVYVRIEGIPPHAWGLEVAEKVLGKDCAIHYVEEHTRRRERTRTFDLWAWSADPCKIPSEVWLTITDPDAEQASTEIPVLQLPTHHDPPTGIKHGLYYRILPHVATVEDLTFIRGNGGLDGPPNRKPRHNFKWRYGIPDSQVDARGRQPGGHGREGPGRHRRDDEDEDRKGHQRRHRSASAWGRVTRCRNGAADCYSSNFRGAGGSYRSRAWMAEPMKLVYKIKVPPTPIINSKSKKRITFADPLYSFLEKPQPRRAAKISERAISSVSLMASSSMLVFDPMLDESMSSWSAVRDNKGAKTADGKKTSEPLTEKIKMHKINKMLEMGAAALASNNTTANYLDKPLNSTEMEALQVLVDHGTKLEKKIGKNKVAALLTETA